MTDRTSPEYRFEIKHHDKKLTDEFTQLSWDFLRKASTLKPGPFRVMCHLLTHAEGYGLLNKSVIARDAGMARGTVDQALNGAEAAGYLIRQPVNNEDGVLVNTNYRVQSSPFSDADKIALSQPIVVAGGVQKLSSTCSKIEQVGVQKLSNIEEHLEEQENNTPLPTVRERDVPSEDSSPLHDQSAVIEEATAAGAAAEDENGDSANTDTGTDAIHIEYLRKLPAAELSKADLQTLGDAGLKLQVMPDRWVTKRNSPHVAFDAEHPVPEWVSAQDREAANQKKIPTWKLTRKAAQLERNPDVNSKTAVLRAWIREQSPHNASMVARGLYQAD
ncbi:hypothetical protein O1W68_07685 [Rhodococcus sp. H36-A4]|uniref:hypothetical protein n=1 Tax=Rhodococcus sp. H36-A4 TaxID=3004353 RepID=UPI0022AE81B1|nr:hypothetical protein [Rhodococcus sp. H36-A4]MCZ4077816.1 hypothetical protein [Rhodococcus sp. H36-A4]